MTRKEFVKRWSPSWFVDDAASFQAGLNSVLEIEKRPLLQALTNLIELVESDPEAQKVGTDLWAAVTVAKMAVDE